MEEEELSTAHRAAGLLEQAGGGRQSVAWHPYTIKLGKILRKASHGDEI